MGGAYYNENDKHMAAWLRELIRHGCIADGEVDERGIEDVEAIELVGFAQHHFFAGIGGWSRALRIAGWPDDRPVWTGSCPCQPFSAAGKREGFEDERHLWPHFYRLIREYGPQRVYGEQAAGKAGWGWLDVVSTDLEAIDYAVGAVELPASGVGAPHRRQRIYWLANSNSEASRGNGRVVSAEEKRRESQGEADRRFADSAQPRSSTSTLADTHGGGCEVERQPQHEDIESQSGNELDGCGVGHFGGADWIRLRDGSFRPVEPGTYPLADGVPARVVKLRGYGNAIVPQVGAHFIEASEEVIA